MRNVIVTGRRLAWEGHRALAIARNMNAEFSSVIEQSQPGLLHFGPADLGDIGKIPDLIKRLHKDFGSIYGLVNNAALGTYGARARIYGHGNDPLHG